MKRIEVSAVRTVISGIAVDFDEKFKYNGFMYKLKNIVQHYPWGSLSDIPDLLGIDNPSKKPFAELWMGTHKKAVSEAIVNDKLIPLDYLLHKNIKLMLGDNIKTLPFLMKILSAAKPLSIQLHPDKKNAELGFNRENALNIPVDSPKRTYKDDNHKPEILCALTFFTALKGFRKYKEIYKLFNFIPCDILKNELKVYKNSLNPKGLKRFYSFMLNLSKSDTNTLINTIKSIKQMSGTPYELCLELEREYGSDVGIFSPLFLNIINLKPEEAIYIKAGELHAYIKGTGIELMASSDNVLRGGLTLKHIDKDELLRLTDFSEANKNSLKTSKESNGEEIYITDNHDFKLSKIKVSEGKSFYSLKENRAKIIICIDGNITITASKNKNSQSLSRGESIFIPAYINEFKITGKGLLFKAT